MSDLRGHIPILIVSTKSYIMVTDESRYIKGSVTSSVSGQGCLNWSLPIGEVF